ncbi:hypothetical protein [uncultured Draconibacterium sp.]|uniref:hypothetical protein n=1 Tax=uncultured Draconibacterium sp. TaxID=1573823 RepID=UPI003216D0C9
MPMQDYSTLLYFVTDFQSIETTEVDINLEESVAKMDFEPSERTIKNILDFARIYDVVETEETGYVEMILN